MSIWFADIIPNVIFLYIFEQHVRLSTHTSFFRVLFFSHILYLRLWLFYQFHFSDENLDYSLLQTVSKWLQAIGMGQYTNNFVEKGFATPRQILKLKEEDLEALGVAPIGHRKKILKAINNTKEQVQDFFKVSIFILTSSGPVNYVDFPDQDFYKFVVLKYIHRSMET